MKKIISLLFFMQASLSFANDQNKILNVSRDVELQKQVAVWEGITNNNASQYRYKILEKMKHDGNKYLLNKQYSKAWIMFSNADSSYPSPRMLVKARDASFTTYIKAKEKGITIYICRDSKIKDDSYSYEMLVYNIKRDYLLALDFNDYDKGSLYREEQNLTKGEREALSNKIICLFDELISFGQCESITKLDHCFE